MKNVIITSYGIDGALSQILYYKLNPGAITITASKESIDKILSSIEPSVLVGFPQEICPYPNCLVIPYSVDNSLTYDLAVKLHVSEKNKKLMKYASLGNKLRSYNETTDSIRQYYTAVGHENFINEFKCVDNLTLTKTKIAMAKAYVSTLQSTCDSIVEIESSCEDGIAICKNSFSGSLYLEDSLIRKYYDDNDPTRLVLMVLWSIDGDSIRLNLKGKLGFGKKVCQEFSSEYRRLSDSSIYLPLTLLSKDENTTIDEVCRNALLDKVQKALGKDKRSYYDKYDKMAIDLDWK